MLNLKNRAKKAQQTPIIVAVLVFLVVLYLFFWPSSSSGTHSSGSPRQAPQLVEQKEVQQFHDFPLFTHDGYKPLKLPVELRKRLTYFWLDNRKEHMKAETTNSKYIYQAGQTDADRASHPPTYIMFLPHLDPTLARDLENYVKSELESWTGVTNLVHSATYGIREYTDGTILANHVDRYDTHVLSAIIHVGDILPREDWMLRVENREMGPVDVPFSRDVDVVLYESATLVHGRPTPFKGDRFANIFFHFAPPNWRHQLDQLPGDW